MGRCARWGTTCSSTPLDTREALKKVWAAPPDAYVFDITRVPSHMRELAIALRSRVATRRVPIVFAGGDSAKVARLRETLPDAAYTAWEDVGGVLAEAIAHPPEAPVVPESLFAGYSGTPLPKKLGVKPGMTVALLGAPETFAETLGPLPEGASLAWDGRMAKPPRRLVRPLSRGVGGRPIPRHRRRGAHAVGCGWRGRSGLRAWPPT